MKSIRKRLTYANVMTTIGVFLLLAGGTAIAARQLGKKTVGTKQLKTNAVTTPKIKKAAVTKAKIKDGAIDATKLADGSATGAKIADGAVTASKIAPGSTVFTQRIARFAPTTTSPPSGVYQVGSYTQGAGEANQILGAIDVKFSAACTLPKSLFAYLLIDAPNPMAPEAKDFIGIVGGGDKTAGEWTRRFDFVPFAGIGGSANRTAPAAATSHNVTITRAGGGCGGGGTAEVIGALVDVLGSK